MSNKNKNKRSLSAPKVSESYNELINSINANIRQLDPDEYKFFFKRYIHNKNSIKINNESETDSTSEEILEVNYELNSIYLSNLNNLNNFLQKSINWHGITLKGNKLLENISLNKFNEFFREYGKKIEKKLKRHVLKFFYPNNNRPKLMGPKMNLTPIPVKRNIYIKNEKEKKDYKSAERAAVILRRLEYTHGLGDKRNQDNKILFYLMKGAVITIEDWWINIYTNKKKKENYDILLSKLNDNKIGEESKDNSISNNNSINNSNSNKKNKFFFKKKINKNSSNKNNTKNKLENKINQNMQRINNIKKAKMNNIKKNKIEVIEINLDDEQFKQNKSHYTIQTGSRKSAPINSNLLINSSKTKSGNKNYTDLNTINNKIKKTSSAKKIHGNNYNNTNYKGKKIKPQAIKLIVSDSAKTENKYKNNFEDKIIKERLNNLKNAIKNIPSDAFSYNSSHPTSNKFSDLISSKKKGIKKISIQNKYKLSSNKKEKNDTDININLINSNTDKNKNKLFSKECDTSKSQSNSNYSQNEKEKTKSKKNKMTSQPKIQAKKIEEKNNNINNNINGFDINKKKLIIEKNNSINIFDINKKGSIKEKNLDKNKKEELVIENNINLLIENEEYNATDKGNNNNKFNLNISKDNINENNNININKENNNNINNENDLQNNKSINVVSVIGYKLKEDDYNNNININNLVNSMNNKSNNELKNSQENNKIEEIDNNENNKMKDINEINDINENKEINIDDINNIIPEKISSDINDKNERKSESNKSNTSNNFIINIKEPSKEENDIKNLKKNFFIKEININNIDNNNKPKNNSFIEEKNRINIFNSQSSKKGKDINIKINNEISGISNNNNSQEISEESFRFNKNSFFFNNANNALLVNIDNNTDYDETEIRRIGLKKNYYARYTTNVIKININNTDYNIISKKEKEKNSCLTERKNLDKMHEKEKQSAFDENLINSKKDSKSSRQDKNSHKINYKIIQNNKPFPAIEKTSFDGSVDEIISNHLIKIHNNNDEINKQRIDKAYNKAQLRKSQNADNININNYDYLNKKESNSDSKKE